MQFDLNIGVGDRIVVEQVSTHLSADWHYRIERLVRVSCNAE